MKKLKVHEPVCGELSTDAELNRCVIEVTDRTSG